ncbi:hypothetical protein J2W24_006239 [Variovorax boronicumulans]|nr:hypothetical protein [Variovorax boronicumulans]
MNPFAQFNFGSVLCHARGDVNERVPLRAIDSLGLERLDFIKADIQGYELEMLRGARRWGGPRHHAAPHPFFSSPAL